MDYDERGLPIGVLPPDILDYLQPGDEVTVRVTKRVGGIFTEKTHETFVVPGDLDDPGEHEETD